MKTAAVQTNEYDKQANAFLAKYGIKCHITLSNTKTAPWSDEIDGKRNHYRVTLSKSYKTKGIYPSRISFDFWDSVHNAQNGIKPTPYSILSCISSEINAPETFEDFCSEFGYNTDSVKERAKLRSTFKRMNSFSKRLREFLSEDEQAALAEIN